MKHVAEKRGRLNNKQMNSNEIIILKEQDNGCHFMQVSRET